jgi:hypothetical protein
VSSLIGAHRAGNTEGKSRMRRSFTLGRKHYASKWQVLEFDDRNSFAEVNKLAYEFATTEDTFRREELQLRLLECFHGYLLKYMNMIIYGQLPMLNAPQGRDAKAFLKLLLSNKSDSLESLRNTCKTLHLAFKDHEDTDQVYDTLAFLFMKICANYDPLYPKKTEKVYKYIESKSVNETHKVEDISDAVGFDCTKCIRILVRGGFLTAVQGPKKIVSGYRRESKWPPPDKYFQITSMGFVGYAQKFFKWYLRNYIIEKMGEIESTENMMQLDSISLTDSMSSEDSDSNTSGAIPHKDGALTDTRGVKWAADVTMMEKWKTLDLSTMNNEWVVHTNDFLFKKLTKEERYLLQLVFVKESTWSDIGKILQCDSEVVHNKFDQIMVYLEGRSKIKSTVKKIKAPE